MIDELIAMLVYEKGAKGFSHSFGSVRMRTRGLLNVSIGLKWRKKKKNKEMIEIISLFNLIFLPAVGIRVS